MEHGAQSQSYQGDTMPTGAFEMITRPPLPSHWTSGVSGGYGGAGASYAQFKSSALDFRSLSITKNYTFRQMKLNIPM